MELFKSKNFEQTSSIKSNAFKTNPSDEIYLEALFSFSSLDPNLALDVLLTIRADSQRVNS